MMGLYRLVSNCISPAMPWWLRRRLSQGKEDPIRWRERLGHASQLRPQGKLIWLHAASVGESNSILPLIDALQERPCHVLVTSGTVTSARLLAQRLPQTVLHHYAPVDTPQATKRFIRHWQPNMGIFVESELWPNLIETAHMHQCRLALIGARMSPGSYRNWQRFPAMIRAILNRFDVIAAQTADDAARLTHLSGRDVTVTGTLKYDAAPLPVQADMLKQLREAIGDRPVWCAASTHEGEEELILAAHQRIKQAIPDVLTILIPRHAGRGEALQRILTARIAPESFARRAAATTITAQTAFYLADTMGELGLWYRLCPLAFIGGSFIPHGGQNAFEAAQLGCAPIIGPYTQNFTAMIDSMQAANAIAQLGDAAALAAQVIDWLQQPAALQAAQTRAKDWAMAQGGALNQTLTLLAPLLEAGHA